MHKTLEVSGSLLAYQEQNANACNTIFFIHGNSASSKMWQEQFTDPLFSKRRLIAIDLPAHGDSDAIDDYSLPNIGKVVATALKELSKDSNYILVGLSLGANVLAEMLSFGIKPIGIVLLAPTVVGEKLPFTAIGIAGFDSRLLFTDEIDEAGIVAYLQAALLSADEELRQVLIEDFKKVKAPFRSQLMQTAIEGKVSDEIELLKKVNLPILVIFGKDEKVINPHYLDSAGLELFENTIFKVDGASHFVSIDQPEDTNNLVARYCQARLSISKA